MARMNRRIVVLLLIVVISFAIMAAGVYWLLGRQKDDHAA